MTVERSILLIVGLVVLASALALAGRKHRPKRCSETLHNFVCLLAQNVVRVYACALLNAVVM